MASASFTSKHRNKTSVRAHIPVNSGPRHALTPHLNLTLARPHRAQEAAVVSMEPEPGADAKGSQVAPLPTSKADFQDLPSPLERPNGLLGDATSPRDSAKPTLAPIRPLGGGDATSPRDSAKPTLAPLSPSAEVPRRTSGSMGRSPRVAPGDAAASPNRPLESPLARAEPPSPLGSPLLKAPARGGAGSSVGGERSSLSMKMGSPGASPMRNGGREVGGRLGHRRAHRGFEVEGHKLD
jgi:hypothetical protein